MSCWFEHAQTLFFDKTPLIVYMCKCIVHNYGIKRMIGITHIACIHFAKAHI